jgi:uncharacterized protein
MKRAVVWLLKAYKWAISPLLLPACRYVPTCSEYAMEAVERYGVVRGGFKAAWRLLRCNPFARGGFDPVIAKSQSAVGREHLDCEGSCGNMTTVQRDLRAGDQLGTISR